MDLFLKHASYAPAPGSAPGGARAARGGARAGVCDGGVATMDASAIIAAASGDIAIPRGTAAEAHPTSQPNEAHRGYEAERAYDVRRSKRRAIASVVRAVLLVLAVPLFVAVVFLASYALTCILDGATPDELVEAFTLLFDQIGGLVQHG